jgi:hypothetical protein
MVDLGHAAVDQPCVPGIALDAVQGTSGRVVTDQIAEREIGAAALERVERAFDLLGL